MASLRLPLRGPAGMVRTASSSRSDYGDRAMATESTARLVQGCGSPKSDNRVSEAVNVRTVWLLNLVAGGILSVCSLRLPTRVVLQRQHDSSYTLAINISLSYHSVRIILPVPRSMRTHYRHYRTNGIHGPGRLPAECRAPLFGDARYG